MLSRLSVRRQTTRPLTSILSGRFSSSQTPRGIETDSCGIPVRPTWSVNQLISSYPSPTLSSGTLKHLHALSALIPPQEGSLEHETLKEELEDLVKLVEAVKLVHVGDEGVAVNDGRIWAQDTGIPLSERDTRDIDGDGAKGRELLRHTTRTSDALYVVDAERVR
jgi:hypothetical protein